MAYMRKQYEAAFKASVVCFVKGKYPEKSSTNTHEPAGTFS